MGYLLSKDQFGEAMRQLGKTYRIFAPVCKKGEGRFKDVDLVRYDFVSDASEIELTVESDYAFKEFMLPLSETLFFFTENQVKEADIDERPVIVFLRSCDMHAVKRLDHMYLENGSEEDWFYRRRRDLVKFALIGCSKSFDDCFCVDMGTRHVPLRYAGSCLCGSFCKSRRHGSGCGAVVCDGESKSCDRSGRHSSQHLQ